MQCLFGWKPSNQTKWRPSRQTAKATQAKATQVSLPALRSHLSSRKLFCGSSTSLHRLSKIASFRPWKTKPATAIAATIFPTAWGSTIDTVGSMLSSLSFSPWTGPECSQTE
ncbi:uncharacterized protein BO95DRAFT_72235 [Aspergillus brunneoviolaceus CBS 621.78]|uniref:Uncharacterized protein n=1 Tax=Aspergillus brunneoviolaceus CBS 621.78 TaxID=1450534 RepID=A0ACD1GFN9_9EURO|nr:hypothetical protein BO95DRAFT_72235 [Aspergillus brunneoviolaceus CBS 621.78]RAH47896.1 hypothetical protein BO95DRAFT_72235 [Aspergillus brunneoviolaceus CBS 621.78]